MVRGGKSNAGCEVIERLFSSPSRLDACWVGRSCWISLVAGVRHPGGKQQGVYGGLSDEQQKRPVGHKHRPSQVEGAANGHDGGGCRRLAALLVHLRATKYII